MEHKLFQQQSQKLILSPQIRQYLKLLQMPVAELEQAVDAEVAENPLLEEKTSDAPPSESSDSPLDQTPNESLASNTQEVRVGEAFERFLDLDESFSGYFSARSLQQEEIYDSQDQKRYQENFVAKPQQLTDYLLWQLKFISFSSDQKKAADFILGNLDDSGFLRITPDEISRISGAKLDSVLYALKQMQALEPAGIAAYNLRDALKLQLERKISDSPVPEGRITPENKIRASLLLAKKIVEDHLPLLEKRNIQALSKVTDASYDEIKQAIAEIGKLDPKPARRFQSSEDLAVTPDAIVYFSDEEDQTLKIEIPDERIPELRISPYYRRLLRDPHTDEKTRQFIKEKMQAAADFIRALSLRKSTLRGITEEIVKIQADFFEKGFAYLKPLRLKDIGQALKIHESTVSRAIHGKYLYTPQGTLSYKSFFSTKMGTTNGVEESQKSIMEKIKGIIAAESSQKPLSDQDISEILEKEGVVIARRTVAKYRELLKILPTHLRKEK